MENVTVLRRIFAVFGISLLITGLLIYFYLQSFEKFNENSKMLLKTMKIQEKIEELMGMIKDTEAGTRGYVLTNEEIFLTPYHIAKAQMTGKINDLKPLIADNPTQISALDSIQILTNKKLELQYFIIHLNKTGNFKFGYKELLHQSKSLMDSITVLSNRMKAEQNKLQILQNLELKEATRYSRIMNTIFSITAISIMLVALLSILWEIHSKKKVKELLKSVLESSQSGIVSFSAHRNAVGRIVDFKFIQVNKIGAKFIGKEVNEIIGKSLLELFPENKNDGMFEAYVEVVETNKVYKIEKFYPRGKFNFWLRIVAVKLEDGMTITFDDISKEKSYEDELKNYILDLKRSNSELEQFAFVASHDLQEPLRKIQTFGDRLRIKSGELLSDHSKIYVDKMMSAASRMTNLINDLLSFSRLSRTNEATERTDLNEVLQDVLSDLEVYIHKTNALITYNDLPTVEGIRSQLYQLFFNLVANAMKFSREGVRPEIKIYSDVFNKVDDVDSHDEESELYVRIVVSDNGIGFDNQYSERIFDIFQRLHGKSEYEGTGIGLAICKRIVANHRGNITATGIINSGATFIIELPVILRN